jgi:hypothetical protein
MKRSELYAKVWTTPMTRLAAELGISDVGLAKACRRHAVPAPPRGYWAKLQAGQKPPQIPLPTPELDIEVHFSTSDPEERARQKEMERKRKEILQVRSKMVLSSIAITFPEQLDNPHPLVKATQRYCERIPKLIEQYKRRGDNAWQTTKAEDRPPSEQHGRFNFFNCGFLNITAALESMDWILRFHDMIFKALVAGGMTIERREAVVDRRGDSSESTAVVVKHDNEVFKIEFSQGYRRVSIATAELARRKLREPWLRNFEYQPSDKLVFRVLGTEYRANKVWEGTQEKLQDKVEEIIRSIFELVPIQAELRLQREAAAVVAQRQAEKSALERRRLTASAEQLKQAFLMFEADERARQLRGFLSRLELSVGDLESPNNERAKVWIDVVRQELAKTHTAHAMLRNCLSVPSWQAWPPDWWPVSSESIPD